MTNNSNSHLERSILKTNKFHFVRLFANKMDYGEEKNRLSLF